MLFHPLRAFILLALGISMFSCSNQQDKPSNNVISLNNNWILQKDNVAIDTVNFPFSLIETLYLNQEIGDPNYEDDFQSISVTPESYTLTQDIQLDPKSFDDKQFELNLGRINGRADIFVNEELAFTSTSYYTHKTVDVKPFLKPGINRLTIQFKADNAKNNHPHFQHGTKHNMAHANIGCLNAFNITETSGLSFSKPYLDYSKYNENTLEVFWNIPITTQEKQTITFEWTFNGKTYIEEKQVKKGQSLQTLYFPIEDPTYWFPYTHGEPFMYSGELNLFKGKELIQTSEIDFGIKHLKWKNNNNQIEFILNGKAIHVFALDYNKPNWYKWATTEEIISYIKHLKTLGVNCIRVSGKEDYLRDDILSLFDKAGIFVWQDLHITTLPKVWKMEAKLSIQQEMISLTETYRNHPSVLSLGGKTENHSDTTENAGLIHYEVFEQVIPKIINTFSDLEYIPNASFVWNDQTNDFGNLSMSSFEYLDVWLREKNKDPYENAWVSKMPSEEITHNYYDYVFKTVGEPIDIESMIYYSELAQNAYLDSLLAVKRGLNPFTIHLPVSYGESGPGIHPSISDYFGYRKAIFYTLLKQNLPLNIRLSEKNGIRSYLMHNNTDSSVKEGVKIFIKNKTGEAVDSLIQYIALRPNQEKSILDWNKNLIPKTWKNKDNRCIEFQYADIKERILINFEDAPIPYPDFKYRVVDETNQQTLEVLSNSFIPYAKIKTSHLGYFSTNFVTLLPNDTLHIPFNSEDTTYPLSVGEIEVFNYYQSFE